MIKNSNYFLGGKHNEKDSYYRGIKLTRVRIDILRYRLMMLFVIVLW